MCGRYVRRGDKQKLAERFHAKPNPPELPMPDADYNVAPTTHQPIIRQCAENARNSGCSRYNKTCSRVLDHSDEPTGSAKHRRQGTRPDQA